MVKNHFNSLLARFSLIFFSFCLTLSLACPFLATPVFAEQIGDQKVCTDATITLDPELREAAGCSEQTSSSDLIARIISILLFAVGFFSVVMIIVSGIRLMLASDVSSAKKARDMIIYSVIGLVIAIFALVIVRAVSYFAYNVGL